MIRSIRFTSVGLLVYLVFGQEIYAQKSRQEEEIYGYYLEQGRKKIHVPFELHSNLIIVPLRINSSDTLRFILDTGVTNMIITDPDALNRADLILTRKVSLTGAGEGAPLTARIAIDNTFRMGQMRANRQNLVIIDEDILRLSEYVGVPVHGIFGYEIFNNFTVTIDFVRKELVLMNKGVYKYRKRKGEKYPITVEDTKPFTEAYALLADGQEHAIRVLIDTGAGHALLLDKSSDERINLPEKVIRTQLGRGLNGIITGSLGRVERMRIGRFELANVVTSFPDSTAYGSKFSGRTVRQGNIGCEVLRRFRVTMNYHEHYVVLKPIRKRLRERFEHDMSGMEIRALGSNLRAYVINHVEADSPADRAGLRLGDQLLFINSSSASHWNISEINKLLQKGNGKELDLVVKRNEKIFFTRLVLRRRI